MKTKVITVTNNIERSEPLINSLGRLGWNTAVLVVEWKGFGTKLISTYEYLKQNPDIDRFVFCDAHDVVVLGTPGEFESKLKDKNKILFNAERGCWPPPVQEFEHLYKTYEHGFNFLNSGVYYSPSKLFIDLMESAMPEYKSDDQWYFSMQYLFGRWGIELDNNCDVFQCYSFFKEDDFSYENNRLHNLKTNSTPIFIHANGGGGMPLIYELLK